MALQEEFEKQGVWLFKYRSNLPIIILVLGYALYCYKELHPEAYFLTGDQLWFDPYFEMICFGVCTLGLLIRVYTVERKKTTETFLTWQVVGLPRPSAWQKVHLRCGLPFLFKTKSRF